MQWTAVKRWRPGLLITLGLSLVVGGVLYFVMVTGFPHPWAGQSEDTFAAWLQRNYTLTYPQPGPTEEAFDACTEFVSIACWLGFGAAFVGLIFDGRIFKQPKTRQVVAGMLGIITGLCAFLELWVCAYWFLIIDWSLWCGYPFDPASMFYLFPPALVCTALSLMLVGPRHSKIALVSFSMFALPLWETLIMIPRWHDYIALKYGT
ncbi:MAG: hypothetical protein KGJ60_04870 [Verrucomicrobiota bacterium]|nr:hypothetical protein [Verrucomicrobiota bacterium]